MDMLTIVLLPGEYGVCRLEGGSPVPDWLQTSEGFVSFTATEDETSVVCLETSIPIGVVSETGFRIFKVIGPLDFSMTGVLSSLLGPLAEVSVSVFTVSTFDTDYILVKKNDLDSSIGALRKVAAVVN